MFERHVNTIITLDLESQLPAMESIQIWEYAAWGSSPSTAKIQVPVLV